MSIFSGAMTASRKKGSSSDSGSKSGSRTDTHSKSDT